MNIMMKLIRMRTPPAIATAIDVASEREKTIEKTVALDMYKNPKILFLGKGWVQSSPRSPRKRILGLDNV